MYIRLPFFAMLHGKTAAPSAAHALCSYELWWSSSLSLQLHYYMLASLIDWRLGLCCVFTNNTCNVQTGRPAADFTWLGYAYAIGLAPERHICWYIYNSPAYNNLCCTMHTVPYTSYTAIPLDAAWLHCRPIAVQRVVIHAADLDYFRCVYQLVSHCNTTATPG